VGDLLVRNAGGAGCGGCSGGVLAVVDPADPRLRRERVVRCELGAVEPEASGDDLRAGALEDPELRAR
jgi:hypothetical protein